MIIQELKKVAIYPVFCKRETEFPQRSLSVLIPHNKLGYHRIVKDAHFISLTNSRLHPHSRTGSGSSQMNQFASAR